MRKTILSIVVAALLALVPISGLCERAEYSEYTNEDLNFSISYPSDWIVINQDTIEDVVKAFKAGDLPHMREETISSLEQNLAENNIPSFFKDDESMQFCLIPVPLGVEIDYEYLNKILIPSFHQINEETTSNYTILEVGSIEEYGANTFAVTVATYDYHPFDLTWYKVDLYFLNETDLYAFTFMFEMNEDFDADYAMELVSGIGASFTVGSSGGLA